MMLFGGALVFLVGFAAGFCAAVWLEDDDDRAEAERRAKPDHRLARFRRFMAARRLNGGGTIMAEPNGIRPEMHAAPWLDLALSERGTKEVHGQEHNPAVLAYFDDVGHDWVKDDETAWCAAFLGSVLTRCGYPLPPLGVRLAARSYLTWGTACEPKPGAVGIWPRGANPSHGHVGFVTSVDAAAGMCELLAGNQGNAVTVATCRIDRALAFRWPVAPTVTALRRAGSTEVKAADRLEIAGVGGAAVAAGGAAAAELLTAPADTPLLPTAPPVDPMDLTLAEQLMAAAKAVAALFVARPWLAGCILAAVIMLVVGRRMKARRVAKAKAGVPLSVEAL